MQIDKLLNVSFGNSFNHKKYPKGQLRVDNILTNEEYDAYSKELSSSAERVIEENNRLLALRKDMDSKCKMKMRKNLQAAIEDLISQGQAVPAKMINLLRSLK